MVAQNIMRTSGVNRKFDLFKAFFYIDNINKFVIYFKKDTFSFTCSQRVLSYHLIYVSTMDLIEYWGWIYYDNSNIDCSNLIHFYLIWFNICLRILYKLLYQLHISSGIIKGCFVCNIYTTSFHNEHFVYLKKTYYCNKNVHISFLKFEFFKQSVWSHCYPTIIYPF